MFSKVENMWPFWEFTDAATALDGIHTDCSLVVWFKNKHCRLSFLIICNDFMNPGKKKVMTSIICNSEVGGGNI